MKNKPTYKVGDRIVYKSGKLGCNYGWDMGKEATVVNILPPVKGVPSSRSLFTGWRVLTDLSNMAFPAGWFRVA